MSFYRSSFSLRRALNVLLNTTLLIIQFSLPSFSQSSQRLSYTSYTINEGLASNLVKDMAFDSNGFLWVSTVLGLQRFDGKTFYSIPQRNNSHGIHYDKGVNFFQLQNGELLVATEKGIAFYNPGNNRFRNFPFPFLRDKLPDQLAIIPLKEEDNTVWLLDRDKIIQADINSGKILFIIPVPPEFINKELMAHAKSVDKNRVLILANRAFILILDTKKKSLSAGYIAKEASLDNFHVLHRDTVLVTTHTGMQKINMQTGKTVSFCQFPGRQQIADFSLTTSLQLSTYIYLVGVNNHLWEFDARLNRFTRQLTDPLGNPFFTANLYSNLVIDKYKNIWAGSYIQGIRKIRYGAPWIKYYGTVEREKNFVKCMYADKENNIVLTGILYAGLQLYDTNGRMIKDIPDFGNIRQPTITAIEKINDNEYLLFLNGKSNLYIYNRETSEIKKLADNYFPFSMAGFGYYFNTFPLGDSSFLLKINNGIYECRKTRENLRTVKIAELPPFETFYLFRHSNGKTWLAGKGRYCLYDPGVKSISVLQINDDVMIKCMTEDNEKNVWIATEKGLYKADANGRIIFQFTSRKGLPDDGIYAVTTDANGGIWFSHNKGISGMNRDGSFFTLDKEDGLQENEFNTNCVFKAPGGELFFGGVNGVNSFYPGKINMNKMDPEVFVTDIKVKEKDWYPDTAYWNMPGIQLSYDQNAIAISFNAIGPENAEQYNYQYRMTGVDEQWINAGNNRTARYVLNPGEYRFQIYAGSGFNEQAISMREIKVIIHPAWWQTWWAQTGMFILVTGVLIIGMVLFNRRKLGKKLQEIKLHQQLQKERERISRDLHDNIGAYTSALIANAEKLQTSGNGNVSEAGRVFENAQQILSSLRETIWVLNSREISITDFADGFKQYANKMLENYPEIQISFEEKIEDDKILSPAVAINLYRILQEALQNSLKYAKANNIDFFICSNDKFSIILKDDGVGFNPAEKGLGNGLNNMEYRAAEVGFDFIIISKSGEGAEVTLSEK